MCQSNLIHNCKISFLYVSMYTDRYTCSKPHRRSLFQKVDFPVKGGLQTARLPSGRFNRQLVYPAPGHQQSGCGLQLHLLRQPSPSLIGRSTPRPMVGSITGTASQSSRAGPSLLPWVALRTNLQPQQLAQQRQYRAGTNLPTFQMAPHWP